MIELGALTPVGQHQAPFPVSIALEGDRMGRVAFYRNSTTAKARTKRSTGQRVKVSAEAEKKPQVWSQQRYDAAVAEAAKAKREQMGKQQQQAEEAKRTDAVSIVPKAKPPKKVTVGVLDHDDSVMPPLSPPTHVPKRKRKADYRLTLEFPGMSKQDFFAVARELDDYVSNTAKNIPKGFETYIFASPEGPPEWDESPVEVRLDGIRADRAQRGRG